MHDHHHCCCHEHNHHHEAQRSTQHNAFKGVMFKTSTHGGASIVTCTVKALNDQATPRNVAFALQSYAKALDEQGAFIGHIKALLSTSKECCKISLSDAEDGAHTEYRLATLDASPILEIASIVFNLDEKTCKERLIQAITPFVEMPIQECREE